MLESTKGQNSDILSKCKDETFGYANMEISIGGSVPPPGTDHT